MPHMPHGEWAHEGLKGLRQAWDREMEPLGQCRIVFRKQTEKDRCQVRVGRRWERGRASRWKLAGKAP